MREGFQRWQIQKAEVFHDSGIYRRWRTSFAMAGYTDEGTQEDQSRLMNTDTNKRKVCHDGVYRKQMSFAMAAYTEDSRSFTMAGCMEDDGRTRRWRHIQKTGGRVS